MKGILLNEDMSLMVKNKNLAIGDTTGQNQKLLIFANKGEIKSRPMRGVGANLYLEDDRPDELARSIRTEFIADGMTVNKVTISPNLEIEIDAYYGKG